jgi:glycosyltransferase involved in cell wall biosynthesis
MRILMVSPEYPPISGGVGRYTFNLVSELKKLDCEVLVLCDQKGYGDYRHISPFNKDIPNIILKVAQDVQPDVIHIQFEPGLYGLKLDHINPSNSKTFLDSFYHKCKIPIITTFHSGYTFKEWMHQSILIKKSGRTGKFGIPARAIVKMWHSFINYKAFMKLNREKLERSHAGICFSSYMTKLLGGGHIIYHGAEPAIMNTPNKNAARKEFSLPIEKKIAVVVGFQTITKGWDLLNKVEMPHDWIMVTNSTKGDYNNEKLDSHFFKCNKDNVIDLKRGYLNDKELSVLLSASDAVLLPYKITSGSGVMFDALAHGLPFISSNLEFFKEFANLRLGITSKRDSRSFANAIKKLGNNYEKYNKSVENFKSKLKWNNVAAQHIQLYNSAKKNVITIK